MESMGKDGPGKEVFSVYHSVGPNTYMANESLEDYSADYLYCKYNLEIIYSSLLLYC